MKNFSRIFFTLCLISLVSCTSKQGEQYNEGINITPAPAEMTVTEGLPFRLKENVAFYAEDEKARTIAVFFAEKIRRSTGFNLTVKSHKPYHAHIKLALDDTIDITEEGYILSVTQERIIINARTPQGLFYGMQTVMQLAPAEIESPVKVRTIKKWYIPAVEIKDEPRFGYRGMHLDVCRHFFDVDFIKKQLDVLAMLKINTFHWHLTDDQGWRVEIKKYPELTTVGAQRTEGEGNTYGPYFYTQDQIREVVGYAKERFIEVIPEIELPGHAVAAIAACPELSCTGEQIPVRNIWGVATDVFCAGNEQTFVFLEDVLTEIIPLFESDYIHIGGDECPKLRWQQCPKCQARIKELGLKASDGHSAEEKLQSWFVQRIEKFLLTRNKKIIGWDEILEGGLAPSATVMSWRGEDGGIAAANMGHDVIMTPGAWCYFDKYQGESKLLNVTIGGSLTLSKVYGYEPIPEKIDLDKTHHILGAQANHWAEYKYTPELMEHDMYPRMLAMAELNWTPKENKNYEDFERRLDNQRVRLDMHGVNYYIPIPETNGFPSCNFMAFTDNTSLEFETTEPVRMVYTLDGTEPGGKSAEYTGPLVFNENATLKIRSVSVSGKMGPVRTITLVKQDYTPAVERLPHRLTVAESTQAEPIYNGILAEYYKGYALSMADIEGKLPESHAIINSPREAGHRIGGYMELYDDDFYTTVLTGYINIPEDGVYYFSTDHEFWIGGELFISNLADNPGTAMRFSRSDRSVALAKGYHPFKLVRLGGIFGGWPAQWDGVGLQIRKAEEQRFSTVGREYFE